MADAVVLQAARAILHRKEKGERLQHRAISVIVSDKDGRFLLHERRRD